MLYLLIFRCLVESKNPLNMKLQYTTEAASK